MRFAIHTTSPAAIERAAHAHSSRQKEADKAAALDALVEGGELDVDRVDDLLTEIAIERMSAEESAQPTVAGRMTGIAVDACSLLIDLQRCIENLDFFSAGDTGLGELQRTAQRANAILQRMGYRNGNAEVCHG